MQNKIGIIGCGNMGEAIISQKLKVKTPLEIAKQFQGLSPGNSTNFSGQKFIFSERNDSRRIFIQKRYRITGFKDNAEVVREANVIILAVKPQDFNKLLNEIRISNINLSTKLFISIAAGITTKYIEKKLRGNPRVMRVMPNLLCTIKRGMSAICLGKYATCEDFKITEKIFSSAGKVVRVKEDKLNAITAVSGSGPAYFYYLIEALFEGALNLGLDAKLAGELILETAQGSLEFLKVKQICPKELRKKITSQSGTTEAAISVFNINDVKEVTKLALKLAAERAKLLSELIEKEDK